MGCPLKSLRTPAVGALVMFVYNLVFLALVATPGVRSGIPQYIQDQWALTDENLLCADTARQSLAAEETTWPDISVEVDKLVLVMLKDQNFPTAPESYVIKEQDYEGGESAVWKIALVAAVLLMSVLGCLGCMGYHLCIGRGNRVHYRPQKDDYA